VDESYLWPDVATARPAGHEDAALSELVAVYPDRASVPRETLLKLLAGAQDHIDVLVFSGTFFAQTQPRVAAMFAERIHAGATVRSLQRSARVCYDDQLLVNPHVYGAPASLNPTFYFRRVGGGCLFEHYVTSFERVWATAMPWAGTET
jgi:hypothetical protein